MPRTSRLPDHFVDVPFTVTAARASGVSPSRLRASDLASPFTGARTPSAVELDLIASCHLVLRMLPADTLVWGPTAAVLHGIPLPLPVEREATAILTLAVQPPTRAVRRKGVWCRQVTVPPDQLQLVGGLPITTPERTWCDLASQVSLKWLVAAGDRIIAREHPLCSRDRLADAVQRFGSRRGRANLDQALPMLSDRAESPRESLLRVIVVSHGLPPVVANAEIRNATGAFVARVDLLFPDHRLVLEYQGDYHRDPDQWRKDMSRIAEIESHGYKVIQVNADDLEDPRRLIAQIKRYLAAR
ncbi:DUF559 domain-containing protein [Rathayibacter sp. YIM 133350]|uniref:endonuclease domain-containing protein n=1 Tax=Rathayibacter sp. YIM 133350 TaxID=3131992 RepID=UPI00307DCA2A